MSRRVDVVEEVRRRVDDALGRLRVTGTHVLVACSGGPDSTVLLDALDALSARHSLVLSVASVDHALRAEAAAEAEAVRQAAVARGLRAVVLRVSVPRPSMASARQARYQALVAHAASIGAEVLAVAHTATDQVETLLDRLVRGAGTRGLSAMPRERPLAPGLRLVRPLLDVTRDEVAAYVAARGLAVAHDPTNINDAYRRSRIRHDVLPLLRRERPDLDLAVVALADRLRADADALDGLAAEAYAGLRSDDGTLDAARLAGLHSAIAARVVALAAGVALESVHVEALLALCRAPHGTRSLDLPGARAERRYGRLRFGPRRPDPGDEQVTVIGPGRYELLAHTVEVGPRAWAAHGPGLILRNLRPGDLVRSGKLKHLLIDRKIPRPDRRWLPLLVRPPNEVLWAPGIVGKELDMSALTRGSPVQ